MLPIRRPQQHGGDGAGAALRGGHLRLAEAPSTWETEHRHRRSAAQRVRPPRDGSAQQSGHFLTTRRELRTKPLLPHRLSQCEWVVCAAPGSHEGGRPGANTLVSTDAGTRTRRWKLPPSTHRERRRPSRQAAHFRAGHTRATVLGRRRLRPQQHQGGPNFVWVSTLNRR